jgi:hypothetical protein
MYTAAVLLLLVLLLLVLLLLSLLLLLLLPAPLMTIVLASLPEGSTHAQHARSRSALAVTAKAHMCDATLTANANHMSLP